MAKEFDLTCLYNGRLSSTLVHQILYVIVSNGGTYNVGRYPGGYTIFTEAEENIEYTEPTPDRERVERLPEIVSEFSTCDLRSDVLTIEMADTRGTTVNYLLSVRQQSDTETVVSIQTSTNDAADEDDVRRLVTIVEELCRRFDMRYATYVSETESLDFPAERTVTPDHLTRVTYFSAELARTLGREKLQTLPEAELTVHDDGGVFLILSLDPYGPYETIERAREYLSTPTS